MAFDEARYLREVLDRGLPVDEDLRHRYQLPAELTAAGVDEAVRAARACWRRHRTRLKYLAVIEELEAGHLPHQAVFEAARGGDLAPLRAAVAEQGRRAAAARDELLATLREAAAGLGLIAPATLARVGAVHGADPARLDEALAALTVTVAAPDPLPRDLPHPAYARCARQLAVLRLRHLADFLTAGAPGEHTDAPVRPFTGPAPTERALEAAALRWGRQPHGAAHTAAQAVAAAARKVLGDLGPEGLRAVLLHELAEPLRARRAARAGAGTLLAHAERGLSVAAPDARRLVLAVREEPDPDPVTARLRALVADGLLAEAAAVLDRLPDRALPPEAAAPAAHVRATLAEARRLGDLASGRRVADPDQAWELLDRAEALVRDLPRLDEVRRSLPVRPVPRVSAAADRTGVLVAWEPTPSTAGRPEYVVVRRVDRAPRSVADGTVLDPPAPGATSLLDTGAPVNAPVHYGVAVRRSAEPDGLYSPLAVCGPVCHRPEVGAARLEADDGVVSGRWRLPAGAEAVRVTRLADPRDTDSADETDDADDADDAEEADPQGRAAPYGTVIPARADGFTDRGRPNGRAHGYRIQALYREDDGTVTATAGLLLGAVPLAPPEPVTALAVAPAEEDPDLFDARFTSPAESARGEVRLYAFDTRPPWPVGRLLSPAEVAARGTRLASRPIAGGLRFRPPGRGAVVVAVTVAGDRAAIGAGEPVVAVPGLRNAAVLRSTGEAVVTFDWPPDGPGEAEVRWRVADGALRRRTVTRLGYLHRDGVRLPVPHGAAAEVELRPVGRADGLPAFGPPVRLVLPARIEVPYTLTRRGLPGRRSVRAVFRSATEVLLPGLVLVASTGPTWPLAAGDGETLAELGAVRIGPGRPAVLTARLPRGRVSWLRCFTLGEEIVLVDPPVSRLRTGARRAEDRS
ncbi:hypothetical protein ACFVFS_33735 [Kitasatospora sp. NPDC057692]|uniref:hypothetical protein n=1 Tax=Kitasatospora sp. NPDC057692 TaxID=3346215 RepID=UPI00367FF507